MRYIFFTLTILFSSSITTADSEEVSYQTSCKRGEILACEKLAAFYIKKENWELALTLGQALCKKNFARGCTFAGTASLAKKQTREGIDYLTKGCDGFEPYACRSLSRLMKQMKEPALSYMFSRRACFYGLSESCRNLSAPKPLYSKNGEIFLRELERDCEDTKASSCKEKLKVLGTCPETLSKQDCGLIPGELSILFRAKLIQEGAKILLLKILAAQKLQKENPQFNRYSYDLAELLKGHEPQSAYHYVFGFMRSCTKRFEKSKEAASTSSYLYKKYYSEVSARSLKNISAFFSKEKGSDCYDPSFGFEAFAAGNLDPLNTGLLDIWKINRDGNIVHLQNGLPKH